MTKQRPLLSDSIIAINDEVKFRWIFTKTADDDKQIDKAKKGKCDKNEIVVVKSTVRCIHYDCVVWLFFFVFQLLEAEYASWSAPGKQSRDDASNKKPLSKRLTVHP